MTKPISCPGYMSIAGCQGALFTESDSDPGGTDSLRQASLITEGERRVWLHGSS